jgi:hypothetical protein
MAGLNNLSDSEREELLDEVENVIAEIQTLILDEITVPEATKVFIRLLGHWMDNWAKEEQDILLSYKDTGEEYDGE